MPTTYNTGTVQSQLNLGAVLTRFYSKTSGSFPLTHTPQVNASAYLECSSTIEFNINALQEEIVKVIILDQQTKAKKETSNFSFGIVKFLLGRWNEASGGERAF